MLEKMVAKAELDQSLPISIRAAKLLVVTSVAFVATVVTEKVFDGGIRSFIAKAAEEAVSS